VTKNYGGVSALSNISLQVAPGEILGIIGSNGAGKTTLFDVASGFVTPDEGHVTMDGVNITRLSPAQRANRGLGRVFQDARLWPSMTVHDAIATALEQFVPVRDPLASALALAQAERSEEQVQVRAEELIEEFGLGRFRDAFVSDLSTGTRRVVELSCAVANDPMVLLLDEPTSGIAQREGEALGELLLGLREQTGAAFIIIEHDVPLVSSLADRMICMHLGQIIAEGDTTDVLTDPVVVAAYLGADAIASHHPEPPRSPVGAATAGGAAPAQRPGTA
jgi:branched-chain amino acid transport system ATP-binding protein